MKTEYRDLPDGLSSSGSCPRGGLVCLVPGDGPRLFLKTTCKTWRCKGCRDRLLNLVKMRIVYGVELLKPTWFITLTFRTATLPESSLTDQTTIRNAESVARVWSRFWSLYRRRHPKRSTPWFRVIELTKRGQPHLHLVVGGLGVNKLAIEREWSFLWLQASKDSHIVWATECFGANGAAGYLTKYMVKAFGEREELLQLGFHRRWSRSRDWPGDKLRLTGTEQEVWHRVDWIHKSHSQADMWAQWAEEDIDSPSPHLVRVGTEMALYLDNRRRRKSRMKEVQALLGGNA